LSLVPFSFKAKKQAGHIKRVKSYYKAEVGCEELFSSFIQIEIVFQSLLK
jgi:hypothetical protein